ncbi:MAG TPA: low affinity iron permease family protein [Candidatus Eisenbacteria bacterium]|nr:low affinity iron permease family protein [Candidatus Eisenbacteria bacterium]
MERFSGTVARWTGGTAALAAAFALVIVWLLSGPIFHYSDTWQLAINTTTTIVTFLMVFLIQRAQNKDARATALKLNEVIAALEGASNRLIDLEDLSEAELDALHEHFRRLVALARKDRVLTASHSVEEAESRHRQKLQGDAS